MMWAAAFFALVAIGCLSAALRLSGECARDEELRDNEELARRLVFAIRCEQLGEEYLEHFKPKGFNPKGERK